MLRDFDIKLVSTSINPPQANAPVEQVHQVILNMLVTKDISNKFFDYIDPWGTTLVYMAWDIRDSYHSTIHATLRKSAF